ncbi:ABC transporter permease [Elioraea sp. Yellowstone]|jgi:phospholipid/cholesterol/gamma-HCH transport system permease protein|uniref:ABC transporter permease n=1 Tax=Elioraea sp. Yellowstone TaxID=2592070 RepID=UPI001154EC2C|nr:ABC transporter permease [Elioraea sp. Yellowstone]TQF81660.1 ABC transporter permease [Elioraea sp. Yellowstone]
MTATTRGSAALALPRRVLAMVGDAAIALLRWPCFVAALGAAVAAAAAAPATWRRPVRSEFQRMMRIAGTRAVWATLGASALVGVAMVYQALYWLGAAGQDRLVGTVITGVLVRELAPVVVGLMLAGRAGTLTLIELGTVRGSARFAALEASGIDPLLLLVVPRVLAFALASVSLTVIFVAGALVTGWAASFAAASSNVGLLAFLDDVLRAMAAGDFVLLPLKGVLIGAVVGLICCAVALGAPELARTPTRLIPRGFAYAILGTFLVSGVVSLVL